MKNLRTATRVTIQRIRHILLHSSSVMHVKNNAGHVYHVGIYKKQTLAYRGAGERGAYLTQANKNRLEQKKVTNNERKRERKKEEKRKYYSNMCKYTTVQLARRGSHNMTCRKCTHERGVYFSVHRPWCSINITLCYAREVLLLRVPFLLQNVPMYLPY